MNKTPIMTQYLAIKVQYPDCLLFFRLGDFYELFYEDAKIASEALDIVLTCRHRNTAQEVPMCGVPAHASDNYIARLIRKGFRVAICEQMGKASGSLKGPVHREVVRVITAGTLTEDTLLEPRYHNFLMALFPREDQVGIASVDISTGDFFMESHAISSLYSVLARMQPREILVPEFFVEHFQDNSGEWKRKINPLPSARFDLGEKRLATFFNVHTIQSFGSFSPDEMAAAGALLDYVLVTQKRNVLLLSRPRKLEKKNFLEMDGFTRRNLEIIQTFSGDKKGSLLESMDRTVTPMGARLLFLRLTHPLRNLAQIQERLDSVSFFVNHTMIRRSMREILAHIPDMERALSRLLMGRSSPRDMGAVYATLSTLPSLTALISTASLPTELESFLAVFSSHEGLLQLLQRALSPDLPAQLRDGNVIAQGYHETLDALRGVKNRNEQIIQQLQKKYEEETQISTLRIRYNQIIGYYIEVSPALSAKVPFHFTLKQSLLSGHRYTTPELAALEQEILSAQENARELEEGLFHSLVEELRAVADSLRQMLRALSTYDVAAALAEVSVLYGYTRPCLEYSPAFSIQGGRHPTVERHFSRAFIKNSCELTQEQPIWIITGPNMAGKSTFLRQNAIIALLAHVGSFVPADCARIGIMDRIFSRVGASDDLARGHSTFMVEMIETATILNQATPQSFVIFDEVGRGTSTYDGLSIAWACIEHLAQRLGCRALFASHYHELAALSGMEKLAFYTLKIQEWERNIVFFHEVIPGIANRSYGIHVARIAGVPESIIHRAETILWELEKGHEKIVIQASASQVP